MANDDWETFEKNNPKIALNVLCIKKLKTCPAYILNINWNCGKK